MTQIAWLIAMLIAQVLDGVLTYFGVSSGIPEGNPICRFFITHLGLVGGLAFVKSFCVIASIELYRQGHHSILRDITIVMYLLAVIPWTLILLTGVRS